jgi:hypothetical protein
MPRRHSATSQASSLTARQPEGEKCFKLFGRVAQFQRREGHTNEAAVVVEP